MNNLQTQYQKEIVPALKEKFSLKNLMTVPRLKKVVINVGVGRNSKDKEFIEYVQESLSAISGQKPVLTKAKQSISGFKLREGMIVGAMVTLRKKRMYDFVEKLVHVTFPRVRDFRGINKTSVDQSGNLTVGIKEHTAFAEIGDTDNIFGLEITLVTNCKNREEGLELFKQLGFPFKK
ncbi:MAG: 50S ribosomal protein L5 [Parcubacteria group bacterium]